MADRIRKVDYYKTEIANRVGEGAKVLGTLKAGKVDLLAFTGFPSGRRVQLDFVPKNAALFRKAAKKAGLKVTLKRGCFLAQGRDRAGAVAAILETLAKAKVSVVALNGVSAGNGRFGAFFWVKPKDVAKAAKALKAS